MAANNYLIKYKAASTIKYIVLILVSLTTIYPFVWVVLSSLKTDNEIYSNPFGFPAKLMFSNYKEAWVGVQIGKSFFNSLMYSTSTVIVVVLVASMAAYVLARVWPSRSLYFYFTIGIMIPIHSVIVPLLISISNLGLINTRPGIILAYSVNSLSFSIFVLVAFMRTLPNDIEDAAMIDGCRRTRMFFTIILPIAKPGLATIGMFAFLDSWNDMLLALIIVVGPNLRSLCVSCFNLRAQYIQRYSLITAGLVLLIIPVTVIYSLFQDQVIKGMTAGAVKG